ncbi:efflux RND transporter permease subunit [Chloroflexota bacterium]
MSWFTKIALKKRWLTFLIVALVTGTSIWATVNMKMEMIPDIDFGATSIVAVYPQAKAIDVMNEVAIPIEGTIADIDGLRQLTSTCTEGSSFTFAFFDYGTDMGKVNNLIKDRLNELDLPEEVRNLPVQMPQLGANPQLYAIDVNIMPVVMFGLSGDLPAETLNEIATTEFVPRLEAIEGVYQVGMSAISPDKVLVSLDVNKINKNGISLSQVAGLLGMGQYSSLDQIRDIAVGRGGLTLGDVSEIETGLAPGTAITRTNSNPSVGISIMKESEANTVSVANAVMDEINDIKTSLGVDVEVVTIFDQSEFIEISINELLREALIGGGLAIIVVFLFLMAFRASLVTAISIPLSILVGFLLMSSFGFTLNILTLSAMAIAVGRVIDDSIVVLEVIVRNLKRGQKFKEAALNGAKEVAAPVTSATIATVVIFLPLAFVGGIVGEMFIPFALTITFALIASLFVALMVIPPLCNFKVSSKDQIKTRDSWYQKLYIPMLKWSLAHRAATLVVVTMLFLGSFALIPVIGTAFIPSMSEKELTVELVMPPGTDLITTEEIVIRLEKALSENPEVRNYQTFIGSSGTLMGGFSAMMSGGTNSATITVILYSDADMEKEANELRQAYADIPGEGVVVNVTTGDAASAQMMGSGLDVSVQGDSFQDVASISEKLVSELMLVDGLADIEVGISSVEPKLDIAIDEAKLLSSGLPQEQIAQIGQELFLMNLGGTIAQANIEGQTVDIFLKGVTPELASADMANELSIGYPITIKLSDIALVKLSEQPVSIQRIDQKLAASITGSIIKKDIGSVNREVQQKIDQLELPVGAEIKMGGTAEMMQESFSGMFMAIIVAALLAYAVIVVTFRSFINPIIIMMSLPLASIGALLGLLITGHPLGVSALMGVLMLVGIVLTNAIVLISLVERLQKEGMSTYDALVEGGKTRLRPILMTAITTVVAMVPIAFGLGEGTLMAAELAVVVIGGLFSSTLLTLLVIPVIFSLVEGLRSRLRGRKTLTS